jgi:hypothetical protein
VAMVSIMTEPFITSRPQAVWGASVMQPMRHGFLLRRQKENCDPGAPAPETTVRTPCPCGRGMRTDLKGSTLMVRSTGYLAHPSSPNSGCVTGHDNRQEPISLDISVRALHGGGHRGRNGRTRRNPRRSRRARGSGVDLSVRRRSA